jgi:hypothetical protein
MGTALNKIILLKPVNIAFKVSKINFFPTPALFECIFLVKHINDETLLS